jgi:ADP-heptose:LPS heptosyltransferase
MAEIDQRVLVFRVGQLGDTLVALPSVRAVAAAFPEAELWLLSDPERPGVVSGGDLLFGTGLFAGRLATPPLDLPIGARLAASARLARDIRRLSFHAAVHLGPSFLPRAHFLRDSLFFRLSGVTRVLGAGSRPSAIEEGISEEEALLRRLAASGLAVPDPSLRRGDLGVGIEEEHRVAEWAASAGDDGGRRWVGVGPGAGMPVNVWPEERFREVVSRLINSHDVWPVVLGGPEDSAAARRLIGAWGRGFDGCGPLSVREAAAALRRCALFLGNDTGTTHLAASEGVRCVAVYSARMPVQVFRPRGDGHAVLWKDVPCRGCALVVCAERQNLCINAVGVEEVVAACETILLGP